MGFLRYLKRPAWIVTRRLTGQRLQATTTFSELRMFGGFFPASSANVQARLPPRFESIEQAPGVTEVQIVALDNRAIDLLGPYHELAISVPVRYLGAGLPVTGRYVLQLPCTTEEARWTGVENYGFPKFVAEIELDETSCTVRHNGELVLAMRVDALPTTPGTSYDRFLTIRDDDTVVTSTLELEGEIGESTDPTTVHVQLGMHAIADQLRALGIRLDHGRAIYAPHARAVLSPGIGIGLVERATVEPIVTAPPARPARTESRAG